MKDGDRFLLEYKAKIDRRNKLALLTELFTWYQLSSFELYLWAYEVRN